ncbi:hypothetical protein HU200_063365 [Digitaria exilis]|uniref:Uncharacterized protein n=1 Tax=Digitaria exilis TaxID=1010633 RepID=A0A835DV96_9POAL|nr:hypothetical protein HU200_063365 [Digitaria exilis]
MSRLSSHLTCNMVPPRHVSTAGGDVDPYAVDVPQPQTATCCTALQRGFAPDSRVQPRYAPVRTPGSAALMQVDEDDDLQPQSAKDGCGGDGEDVVGMAPATKKTNAMSSKAVRKCKSTLEDVDVSQLETPRLRRSGAVRRDWSFENLRAGKNAAA